MKSFVIAGLVLVLALVLALGLWFSGRTRHGGAAAARPASSVNGSAESTAALEEQDKPAEALETVVDEGQKRAQLSTKVASGPQLSITGRVATALDCQDDEIEVYVLANSTKVSSLQYMVDQVAKTGRADRMFLAHGRAAPDGTFKLDVAPDTSHAFAFALGRYVYSREPVEVDLHTLAPVSIATTCGACIAGRVTTPADDSSRAAAIESIDVDLDLSLEARISGGSDAAGGHRSVRLKDGHFEFRALDATKGYELGITLETLAEHDEKVTELAAGRTKSLDVKLVTGGILRGVVRGSDGAPIAGAQVAAKRRGGWFGFNDHVVRSGTSKTDGTFELSAVAPGEVLVNAESKGLLPGEPLKVTVSDGGLVEGLVVELGSGKSIAGRVRWSNGDPGASLKVDVEFDKSQMIGMTAFNAAKGANGSAIADAEGQFTVTGLGPGPFTVKVEAPAPADAAALKDASDTERSKRLHRARLDGVKPGTVNLELVLTPPISVRGRVVNTAGEPLTRFHVHAAGVGSGMLKNFGQDSIDDDIESPTGEFSILVPREGAWSVSVSAAEHATSEPIEISLPRKPTDAELVIELEKAAVVLGLVVDPRGVPVEGATVEFATQDANWMKALSDVKPPSAKTTAGGKFVLGGLKSGHIALVADAKDWAKSVGTPFDLVAGETREGAVLTLRMGGHLTGEVYDNGKPGSAMLIQATLLKSFDQKSSTSDALGRFEIKNLDPGTYQVVAMHTGAVAGAKDSGAIDPAELMSKLKMGSAELKEGEETHIVLGAPPTDPVHVHGRVLHSGSPYSGAMVVFMGESKDVLSGMKTSAVGGDGSYAVDLDGPGRYSVTVQKVSGKPGEQTSLEFARTIPAVKDCELDLAMPTGRISGRVFGADGSPAPGASVSLTSDEGLQAGSVFGGQFTLGSTDAEGRYDIDTIKPGVYTVAVGGSPFGGLLGGEGKLGRAARSNLRVTEGQWQKDVDFRLEKPGTVIVNVVDADAKPVSGACVFARDSEGRLVDALSMLMTATDGTAKYSGLAPGRYTFTARLGARTSNDSARIDVDSESTKNAQVALVNGTVLIVRVVDKDDKPAEAFLTVLDEAGRDVANMVGAQELQERMSGNSTSRSEQRVGPLAPGKYRARAVRADGKVVEKPVSLSGQPERAVRLQFGD